MRGKTREFAGFLPVQHGTLVFGMNRIATRLADHAILRLALSPVSKSAQTIARRISTVQRA
jgi:hypothetical protein